MKTQKRNFVVEFKSARRRSPMPDSIWGNTDLKAHAREAEAEAPHLFESNVTSEDLREEAEMPADAQHQTQPIEDKGAENPEHVSASIVEAQQISAEPDGATSHPIAVFKVRKEAAEPRSKRMSKQQLTTSAKRHDPFVSNTSEARSDSSDVEASSDELVALEIENQRLRGLLARQLKQENLDLLNMLARFS